MSVGRSECHVGDYITCMSKVIPSHHLVKIVELDYDRVFVEYFGKQYSIEYRMILTNQDGKDRIRRFDAQLEELDSI